MSIQSVFFYISLGVLLTTTVLAFFTKKLTKKFPGFKPIYLRIAGAFLAIYIMLLFVDYKPTVHGDTTTFFLAFFHAIQVMLAGYDYEFLHTTMTLSKAFDSIHFLYTAFLFVLCPIYTFSFVLSFFESVTAYLKYLLNFKADLYIISELSDKSIVLARSLRESFPKCMIIFMDADGAKDSVGDLKAEAKEINAISMKKEISHAGLRLHSSKAKVTFFAINKNETLNIESALALIGRFSNRTNTELYVFSNSQEGGLLLDSVSYGAMKVRRIDESRTLVYSMLHNQPITKEITLRNDKKIISPLIVGAGGYGTELIKAFLWCGQLPGYELRINVIDKDPLAESKFRAQCPEIMELNHNTEIGEACYSLNFINGVDIHSHKFYEEVSRLTETSVVYVSLGNDETNIETAINLRILFERMGCYPTIRTIVYSDIKYQTLLSGNLVNYRGESYDIEILGNINERYSYSSIIDEALEGLALECHLRWSNSPEEKGSATKQFNEYEYFRKSSLATAIHERYRDCERVGDETASIFEHMRWNAFMRTEGYVFSGSIDKSSRNDRAKMHHNLHRYGLLTTEDIEKDRRIVQKINPDEQA